MHMCLLVRCRIISTVGNTGSLNSLCGLLRRHPFIVDFFVRQVVCFRHRQGSHSPDFPKENRIFKIENGNSM